MNDPTIDKWRGALRRTAEAPAEPRKAGQEYEAFHGADASAFLKIQRPGAPVHRPYYVDLMNVIDDAPHGTNGMLVYWSGMMVMITGRNLAPMFEAIARHQVEWVQAFDADFFALPQDKTKPFIATIQITGVAAEENDKGGK